MLWCSGERQIHQELFSIQEAECRADMWRVLRELGRKAPPDRRWLFSSRKNLSLKCRWALIRENVFLGSLGPLLHPISYSPKGSSESSLGGRSGTATLKPIFWQGINLTFSGPDLVRTWKGFDIHEQQNSKKKKKGQKSYSPIYSASSCVCEV